MSTDSSDGTEPISIAAAFAELDSYREQRDENTYDVEAGLAELKKRVTGQTDSDAETSGEATSDVHPDLEVTDSAITSAISPERATRDETGSWKLSWLPDRELTFAQALAGMEFDTLVSNYELANDTAAQARLEHLATQLDLTVMEALTLLTERITDQMNAKSAPPPLPGTGLRRQLIDPRSALRTRTGDARR
ncbi:hypothetical protein [Nocardia brasiliensis]|uniref:Uncharacterized protein n=1 Tax=Nocardia brasiliensis (strain ATCC 700358 / HUJEG-1) TaxID=1133849 RepID=K0F0I0_NOCB7|nr:hypothetical protein [Nocardia brasiliensis]AFU02884.1 hypothetical protein O3I_024655 [Nocardia brasiliensis ATCC 700358]OCF85963.1 hypothetical protein AW168_32880 [Nocardia brasiliensis]